MPLAAGTRFGPYEIVDLLGAGGMGEVYRARDTRLAREVALKVLPESLSADQDRVERFAQEARSAGALNHPHILVVHDVGEQNGTPYIVAELLDGSTLRDELRRGPLSTRQIGDFGVQVASGLAAAHDRGIIHRDLKPENLFVTREGQVKILDFGLAKLVEAGDGDDPRLDSATRLTNTAPGVLVGTVAYMSPEQAEGGLVDHRSDIFSLGTVLYELLSGAHPFTRDSLVETLHAVLKHDPPELAVTHPPAAALHAIVRRCLEKKPERRFQHARDVAFAIEAATASSGAYVTPAPAPATTRPRHRVWHQVAWTLGALLAVLSASAVWAPRPREAEARVVRFDILPPDRAVVQPAGTSEGIASAMAPDGHAVVLVVTTEGRRQLFVRRLDSAAGVVLEGTDGASNPFWSPDSRWIAFFSEGRLMKVRASGGAPQAICPVVGVGSGAWGAADAIVFSQTGGLFRVSAEGGEPVPLLVMGPGEYARWPAFLPDSRHFLYLHLNLGSRGNPTPGGNRSELRIASLDPAAPTRPLFALDSRAIYVPPGYLLFVREGTLQAQPFDPARLAVTGAAVAVADGLAYLQPTGSADFSASDTGVLVYQHASTPSRLVYHTRDGSEAGGLSSDDMYPVRFRLSPDGQRLALALRDDRTGTADLWLLHLVRGTLSRFTFGSGHESWPVWSPDGLQLVFSADRDAPPFLHVKEVGGEGPGEPVIPPRYPQAAWDWVATARGELIIYTERSPETGDDLFLVSPIDRTPRPFVRTRFDETQASCSADRRWVAYVSNASGRNEVYVRQLEGHGAVQQISTAGGSNPKWRRDGRELYYVGADGRLMAVAVRSTGSGLDAGPPEALFTMYAEDNHYDVTPDGQRFLLTKPSGAQRGVAVIVNWAASLPR